MTSFLIVSALRNLKILKAISDWKPYKCCINLRNCKVLKLNSTFVRFWSEIGIFNSILMTNFDHVKFHRNFQNKKELIMTQFQKLTKEKRKKQLTSIVALFSGSRTNIDAISLRHSDEIWGGIVYLQSIIIVSVSESLASWNGGWPQTSIYKITPNDHTSTAGAS